MASEGRMIMGYIQTNVGLVKNRRNHFHIYIEFPLMTLYRYSLQATGMHKYNFPTTGADPEQVITERPQTLQGLLKMSKITNHGRPLWSHGTRLVTLPGGALNFGY